MKAILCLTTFNRSYEGLMLGLKSDKAAPLSIPTDPAVLKPIHVLPTLR
mgnify:CR=1